MRWRTSSHSNPSGETCVEIGRHREAVCIRDSKNRSGPMIRLSSGDWSSLIAALRELR
ncbi:MAG: DUF397 domain-containing protein [Spirillospora sp.]